MRWVIVIHEEHEDYGEGGMVVTDELAGVVGTFETKEAADEYDRRAYPPGPFRTTEVIEMTETGDTDGT